MAGQVEPAPVEHQGLELGRGLTAHDVNQRRRGELVRPALWFGPVQIFDGDRGRGAVDRQVVGIVVQPLVARSVVVPGGAVNGRITLVGVIGSLVVGLGQGGHHGVADRLDLDARRSVLGSAGDQGSTQQDLAGCARVGGGQGCGQVDLGGTEHTGGHERLHPWDRGGHQMGHVHTRSPKVDGPANSSLSSATTAGGTCQVKTPARVARPSSMSDGVGSPTIPRTKR